MGYGFENEMDKEIAFRIQQATQEYIAKGLSPDEARRQARKDFGAADLVKEEIRDTLPFRCFADFTEDLRFIVRGLCRDRMFAIASITMLTLAIGLNVTVFAVINSSNFGQITSDISGNNGLQAGDYRVIQLALKLAF